MRSHTVTLAPRRSLPLDICGRRWCAWLLPLRTHTTALTVHALACGAVVGIEGLPSFVAASAGFALGDASPALADGRVASLQTLSGTGSLRVCADVLLKIAGVTELYLPKPSWGNHAKIFGAAGLEVKEYGYLDQKGTALDFSLMRDDLRLESAFFAPFCTKSDRFYLDRLGTNLGKS